MAKLKDQIDKVKQSLASNTADEDTPPRGVKKVAKKTKPETEEEEAPASKKGKGPKKVVKATKSDKKSAKSNGKAQSVPDGHVSVADLASEAQITAQSARVKLRASEMERPEGRWVFAEGSKLLKEARKVLGLA